jgi:hypothetical protein
MNYYSLVIKNHNLICKKKQLIRTKEMAKKMRWICLLGQVLNPIKEPFLFANFRVKKPYFNKAGFT